MLFVFADILKNCENELLNCNANLFNVDDNLLSEFDDSSLPMEESDLDFNFLTSSSSPPLVVEKSKDQDLLNNHRNRVSSSTNGIIQKSSPPPPPQPTGIPTVFGPRYTISTQLGSTNYVSSPVVTLAPAAVVNVNGSTTHQRPQLLLPAKIIKSEPVVYSGAGAQGMSSINQIQQHHHHQIHTLVNTGNGTVLATGKLINYTCYVVFVSDQI